MQPLPSIHARGQQRAYFVRVGVGVTRDERRCNERTYTLVFSSIGQRFSFPFYSAYVYVRLAAVPAQFLFALALSLTSLDETS
jgi:hypothetical protein